MRQYQKSSIALDLLGFGGIIAYIHTALYFAHFQTVVLDEGSYLYKGWLFVQGIYHPFQPYGPWTNKMPWSFLIYGFAEKLWGAGLETGRYCSILFSVIGWLGVWCFSRKWGNKYWGSLIPWIATASLTLTRVYSLAISESIVSSLAVWSLYFLFKSPQERPKYMYMFLSGLIAGLASVTRINMVLLWLFVIIAAWRHYGWSQAKWVFIGSMIFPVWTYITYWPNILRLWAPWLPIVKIWLPPTHTAQIKFMTSPITLARRAGAIADVLRSHPLVWLSLWVISIETISTLFKRQKKVSLQIGAHLTILIWMLVLLHAWPTIGNLHHGNLVFNLTVYTAFFAPLIFMTTSIFFQDFWQHIHTPSKWHLVGTFTIITSILLSGILSQKYLVLEAIVQVIRAIEGLLIKITGGLFPFNISNSIAPPTPSQRTIIFVAISLTITLIILWRGRASLRYLQTISRSRLLGYFFMVIFLLLSISPLLGNSFHPYDCKMADSIEINAQIGQELSQHLFPNATVYWEGIEAVTPLLYLPYNITTFPPQYNGRFNFVQGGEPDTLYRLGLWNQALADQWLKQADIILVSKGDVLNNTSLQQFLSTHHFAEFAVTSPLQPCNDPLSRIVVYKKRAER